MSDASEQGGVPGGESWQAAPRVSSESAHQPEVAQEYEAQLRQLQLQLNIVTERLHVIESTRCWQIAMWWYRQKAKYFPAGSRRERAFFLVRSTLDILVLEGPGALLKRGLRWLRGERRYYVKPRHQSDLAELAIRGGTGGVLFVISDAPTSSHRYRVYHMLERLALAQVRCDVRQVATISEQIDYAHTFDLVVFHRLTRSAALDVLLDALKRDGVRLAYDLDDYLLDPAYVPVPTRQHLASKDVRLEYQRSIYLHREFAQRTGYLIASTETIAASARAMGLEAVVIRNGLGARQIALSEEIVVARRLSVQERKHVRIGYLSGSSTHEGDFAQVAQPIKQILETYAHVVLSIRGYLDLPDTLKHLEERVERLPFVPWEQLIRETAHLDINIAPLEPDNPFTHAKSALKYWETALIEVPTVASPTEDFRLAIRHGETGFLAASEQDWYGCLAHLVEDPVLRHRMGAAAREDALAHYSPEGQVVEVVKQYLSLVETHGDPPEAER